MMRNLWRWVSGLVMVAALVITTSVGAAESYTDPQGRFSFTIPDGYTQASPAPFVQYTSGSPVVGVFNVVAQPATPAASLDDIAAQIPGVFSKIFKDYQTIPNSTVASTLGGQPARTLGTIITDNGIRLRLNQIYAYGDGTFVVFSYGGLEADFATVEQQVAPTIASFKFGSGTPATIPSTPPVVVSTVTPVAVPATTPAVSIAVTSVAPLATASTPTSAPVFSPPTQAVPTGPTGLPQLPFTPRRVGNG